MSGSEPIKRLFVTNLTDPTEEDLRQIFGEFGDIDFIKIPGRGNKGIAYVHYVDESINQMVISKTDGMKYKERILKVQPADPPKPSTHDIGHRREDDGYSRRRIPSRYDYDDFDDDHRRRPSPPHPDTLIRRLINRAVNLKGIAEDLEHDLLSFEPRRTDDRRDYSRRDEYDRR